MVPVGARSFLSGIRATQEGDARAHCQEGLLHCASADRSAGSLGPTAAHSEAKDEEVAEAGLSIGDLTEGWVMTEFLTEVCP